MLIILVSQIIDFRLLSGLLYVLLLIILRSIQETLFLFIHGRNEVWLEVMCWYSMETIILHTCSSSLRVSLSLALDTHTHCFSRDFCTGILHSEPPHSWAAVMLPTKHSSHVYNESRHYQSLLMTLSSGDPKIIKTQPLLFRNSSSHGSSTDKQKAL